MGNSSLNATYCLAVTLQNLPDTGFGREDSGNYIKNTNALKNGQCPLFSKIVMVFCLEAKLILNNCKKYYGTFLSVM